MSPSHRRWGALLAEWPLVLAYVLLGVCATLVLIHGVASPSVRAQGGQVITWTWGILCGGGALAGLVGLGARHGAWEISGVAMAAVANLVFSVALVLQAWDTDRAESLPAACMTGFVACLCVQRMRELARGA